MLQTTTISSVIALASLKYSYEPGNIKLWRKSDYVKIEHIAIWTDDLETSREFYTQFFGAISGKKYENARKGFSSYFLRFEDGCRLEIMRMNNGSKSENNGEERYRGLSHFAVSVGEKEKVNKLTEELRERGFAIVSEARETGDGYYESVILDPDGNRIEVTI